MNIEQYTALVKNPDLVSEQHIPDLREILLHSPYCATTRMLLLNALKKSESVHYQSELMRTVVYAPNPRTLYFYLHPEMAQKRIVKTSGGGYFDMLDAVERSGQDTQQSLNELAEKLKMARESLLQKKEAPHSTITEAILKNEASQPIDAKIDEPNATEAEAKQLIKEKKYNEALNILREIANSNAKTTYIEDQIRFLEKIV